MVDRVESLGVGGAGAGDGNSIARNVIYGGAITTTIMFSRCNTGAVGTIYWSIAPAGEGVAVVDRSGVSDSEGFGSVVTNDRFLFWSVSTATSTIY